MKEAVWRAVAWTPVIHAVDLAFGALLCFVIAYNRGDVSIYLPYISETGAIVPEMNIYSSFLIFAAFVGAIAMFYRYLMLSYIIEEDDKMLRVINIIGFFFGLASMAFLAAIAAFPMSTLLLIHVLVASIHFGATTIYSLLQAYISFKMKPPYLNKSLSRIRIGIAVYLVITATLMTIVMPLAHFQWIKYYPRRLEATKTPDDKGFSMLLAGSMFEWLWYTGWLFFFMSFTWENKKFELVTLARPKEDGAKDLEGTPSANNNTGSSTTTIVY